MTIRRKVLPAIALIGVTIAGGARATTMPINVMRIVDLHARCRAHQEKPTSWKDSFFPEPWIE